jgi:hypothetical protein
MTYPPPQPPDRGAQQPSVPPPPPADPHRPYGQPQPAYGYSTYGQPRTGTSGFAIASMVLGIVGVIPFLIWNGIASILALVFGYIARSQIKRSGGTQGGRGMALAGIILGWIGIALLVILIVVLIIAVAKSDNNTKDSELLRHMVSA